MENQHQLIKGYRDLNEREITLVNDIKTAGEELSLLLDEVAEHLANQQDELRRNRSAEATAELQRIDQAEPQRWLAMARTDLQRGLMALTRAVAQPGSF